MNKIENFKLVVRIMVTIALLLLLLPIWLINIIILLPTVPIAWAFGSDWKNPDSFIWYYIWCVTFPKEIYKIARGK